MSKEEQTDSDFVLYHLMLNNGAEILGMEIENLSSQKSKIFTNVVKLLRGTSSEGEYFILQNFVPFQLHNEITIDKRNIVTTVLIDTKEMKELYLDYLEAYDMQDFAVDEEEFVGTIH